MTSLRIKTTSSIEMCVHACICVSFLHVHVFLPYIEGLCLTFDRNLTVSMPSIR
jgi:hypothetical protein